MIYLCSYPTRFNVSASKHVILMHGGGGGGGGYMNLIFKYRKKYIKRMLS